MSAVGRSLTDAAEKRASSPGSSRGRYPLAVTVWVYMMTNKPRGLFYVGITNDPPARLAEHLSGKGAKHVRRYGLNRVVWFQAHACRDDALAVEARMKRWARPIKIDAVERDNPQWLDLSRDWFAEAASTPAWN